MTGSTDDDIGEALRAEPHPPAPDALRARLRGELERELAAARSAPPEAADDSGRGAGTSSSSDAATDDEADEPAIVIELADDDRRRAPAVRRLAWVALVLAIAASVAVIAQATDGGLTDAGTADAVIDGRADPVSEADAACAAFVDATSVDGTTFEVLVSNGRQLWIELDIAPDQHLGIVTEATGELRAALLEADFAGPDAVTLARAVGHLDELTTLTGTAADLGPDEAFEIVSRLRDPLVAAELELASLGVAGCT